VARFVKDGRTAWAAWSVDNLPRSSRITLPPGHWRVSHILGEAKEATSTSGRDADIDVDKMPVIISAW
jgi:hypothetical protein